uniref:CCR4-NOT transcription complex subunit 10 n=2 Tax=Cacopsylla melanoneura TaxID=428564 RepID=A0A8D8VMR5_9HEMI
MDKDHSSEGTSLSDQERDFAQLALNEFNRGSFGSCLQYITKLESIRAKDVKVLHNKYVTEYFKSDLCKTDQFRKNMNVVCNQAKINMENLEQLEDVEHCIIYYNQAVLLYHLKHHSTALKIMNKVFTFIEPMEESLAHRVCLLLVELHLCTCQPEKALSLISYIENQFVSTENATKMTIGSGTDGKDIKSLEKEHRPLADLDAATDAFRLKLLQYRVRCYLYTCALKRATEELRIISETSPSPPPAAATSSKTSPGPSNGHSPPGGEAIPQSLPLVCLHAQVEYLRKNYKHAISTLSQIPLHHDYTAYFKEKGESPIVCFYNNMGCIHHYMAKPNLSSFFFNKAVQENMELYKKYPIPDPNEPLSGRSLYMLANNKTAQLMYNLGISLLHGGKPVPAFEYLTQAVQVYHDNPRLWLRLAECCIMAHKSGNAMDLNINERKKDIILNTIGSGAHRKIVLNQDIFNNIKYSCEAESYAIPVASLEFASLCLRNALVLCSPAILHSPSPSPQSPSSETALADLQCCILAAAAYTSLCLGDPNVALGHASLLLSQPNLSPLHRFLGHLYSAEALVLLNKTGEAIEHLSSSHLSDNFPDSEASALHLRKWLPTSLPSAKAVLEYNLATALTIRGEMTKAADILKHVWLSKGSSSEIPVQVISLALYIELALGHSDVAHSIVMQNCAPNNIRT